MATPHVYVPAPCVHATQLQAAQNGADPNTDAVRPYRQCIHDEPAIRPDSWSCVSRLQLWQPKPNVAHMQHSHGKSKDKLGPRKPESDGNACAPSAQQSAAHL